MRKNIKNKISNQSGFTLMEMMVSIAIIVIISGISLVNFRSYDKRNKVDLAAYKLASDIRMVQGYALSQKEFFGSVPSGGWGMRLRNGNNYYVIYADKDNSNKYLSSEDPTPNNENFQAINLENGVSISGLNFNGTADRTFCYINHIPPEPEIIIKAANNESNDFFTAPANVDYARISLTGNGYTRTVIINKFGLVDVD